MTNPLLARFTGAAVSVFVAPEMQAQFETCLNETHAQTQSPEFRAAERADSGDFWGFDPGSYMSHLRPYCVKDGILQIPVKGVLLHNFPYALFSYATGYEYIWQAFQRGLGDANVKGIALVCDSPGGEVAGNFDLVDKMFAAKGAKPVRGYAAESAYSAAYSILSVADVVTVSRTGGVGSIGVVTGHVDLSGAMEKAGIKFTYIFAGAHKVDGNPYETLPADVKARIQQRIDTLYGVFVDTVARNRGMDPQAIRDTEAQMFMAQEALSLGLADKIGALDDALAEYAADLAPDEGDETMSTKDGSVELAAHETALASARTEGHAAGRTEGLEAGRAEGAAAERGRVNAILDSEEAKDRPAAALRAATKTGLSVDEAKAFLAGLPKEAAVQAPSAAATPMDKMDQSGGAEVGPGEDPASEQAKRASPEHAMAMARAYAIPGLRYPEPAKA